jgi:hypothetical protein
MLSARELIAGVMFRSLLATWYGQPTYSRQVTDALNTTDQASRTSHSYMVTSDRTGPLTSTFPGEFNYIPVTLGLDTASTTISFRMAINPANNGVRHTRIADQLLSYQTANVYIDGIFAGTWMEPWNNPDSRWLNDVFEIPMALPERRSGRLPIMK